MTNKDKFLKDGVSVEEFAKEFESFCDSLSENFIVLTYKQEMENFLNCEIKPTLIEDERVILRNINTEVYDVIGRDSDFDLYIAGKVDWKGNKVSTKDNIEQFFKDNVFTFLKERRRI